MLSWSRLRYLSIGDWQLFVTAVALLPLLSVALHLLGFRRVYVALLVLSPRPSLLSTSASDAHIYQLVRMVNAAANRGLVRATCLRRALAIWWLLRLRRVASDLKIGVRRQDGLFEAHAWVERNDIVLNDRADIGQEFAVLDLSGSLAGMRWV